MIKRLSDRLYSLSKGRVALLSLVGFLLFTALVLPGQAAKAQEYASGLGSPDMSFIYSSQDLYSMAEVYGQAGRQAYIHARFSFDLVFPLVYTVFLAASTSWLLGRALAQKSPWRRMNLLPLAAMGFDYLENLTTSVVMSRFPAPSPLAAFLAPPFTFIKWLLVGGSFLVLTAALVLFLIRKK